MVLVLAALVVGQQAKNRHENDANDEEECADLVLHYHNVYGFGVYAGRNYSVGEYLEIAPNVVVVEQERFQDTALIDYVEEVNETFVSIAFGTCWWRWSRLSTL